jgi:hypothetical protein
MIITKELFPDLDDIIPDTKIGQSYFRNCIRTNHPCVNNGIFTTTLPGKGSVEAWLSRHPTSPSCLECHAQPASRIIDLEFKS